METKKIRVYSIVKRRCDNCTILKKFLTDEDIEYETIDIESADAMTELFHKGVFAMSAPILRIGDEFYISVSTRERLKNILRINGIYKKDEKDCIINVEKV